jgi:dihydrofolate synthase/folylpolyglutamate synthase
MIPEFTRYDETVKYLYALQKFGIKLGLSNISKLLQVLGEPHRKFRAVHIAGTNGKGSTAAALASILQESGYRVGLFTSPHLASFTERIRINNEQISESEVIETAASIYKSIKSVEMNPTFFEFVTAMAFYYFAKNNVDWAVIETGLGGRLDATNIIHPEVSIITNISYDHSEFLGNSLSEITFEKAGIIKNHVPVVTSASQPAVIHQLSEITGRRDSDIHIFDRDFRGSLIDMDYNRIVFSYSGYTGFDNLIAPLPGKYQLYNSCMALRAGELLRLNGATISDDSVRKGLLNMQIEGRLEWISESTPIIIDGAHNVQAAESLAETVKELFADKNIILVLGIMEDKDIKHIIKPLVRIAGSVILTKPDYERAAHPLKLREIIKDLACSNTGSRSLTLTESVSEAMDCARNNCGKDDVILVTGSFYTTGAVKELLGYPAVMSNLREK